jgi:hypothetical protein
MLSHRPPSVSVIKQNEKEPRIDESKEAHNPAPQSTFNSTGKVDQVLLQHLI